MLTGTFQDVQRNATNGKTAATTEGYARFHLPRFFLSSWFKSTRPDHHFQINCSSNPLPNINLAIFAPRGTILIVTRAAIRHFPISSTFVVRGWLVAPHSTERFATVVVQRSASAFATLDATQRYGSRA